MTVIAFVRKQLYRYFIDLRLLSKRNTPFDEFIRIELLVAMCLLCFTIGMTYIFISLFFGISLMSVLNYFIFYLTTIPSVLFLVKKGYHNYGKLIMMITGNIFMFIKASSHGPEAGMNLAMLIILFATFAFFSFDDYMFILLSLLINIGSIVVLERTNYSLLDNDQSTNQYEYEFNYGATILFCILFFYVVIRINQYINGKLIRVNEKLTNRNKTLGKINKELDSYIYRASHDMRAPLTSLMGIVGLLKAEKEESKVNHLIQLQENCIQKLDEHIKQIILLSKNTKTTLNIGEVRFKDTLNGIFEELNFFENASNTKKTIVINQIIPFHSDPERVKVIFSNLLSNVFKYSKKEQAEVEVEIKVTLEQVVIKIKDNGIGIAEEHLGHIFEMFYRGTEKSKGTGLGLYIVHEIVQKLQGTISVQSEEDQYTFFTVILPNLKS